MDQANIAERGLLLILDIGLNKESAMACTIRYPIS